MDIIQNDGSFSWLDASEGIELYNGKHLVTEIVWNDVKEWENRILDATLVCYTAFL